MPDDFEVFSAAPEQVDPSAELTQLLVECSPSEAELEEQIRRLMKNEQLDDKRFDIEFMRQSQDVPPGLDLPALLPGHVHVWIKPIPELESGDAKEDDWRYLTGPVLDSLQQRWPSATYRGERYEHPGYIIIPNLKVEVPTEAPKK